MTSNVGRLTATPTSTTPKLKNKMKSSTSVSSTNASMTKTDSQLVDLFSQDQKSSVFVNGNSL